ncbi:hypothetical protein ACQP04_07855 [Pseudonocardia halophobica]|uniref:hypothetical protein n=1 Tax=Pseudonocardia halophobica TaxID=29401 RepID=UPI003D93269E
MFVHGHPRALGWVKGHYRAPTAPEGEQLGFELELTVPSIPGPRVADDPPVRSRARLSPSRLVTAGSESPIAMPPKPPSSEVATSGGTAPPGL